MGKRLTLSLLLFFAATVFCVASARKVRLAHKTYPSTYLYSDTVSASNILGFAESLIGTVYRAGSLDPSRGFDCSGFVNYVFKKFNFNVPRSSYDFVNIGQKIKLEDALPGDIILFTGTKKHTRRIGHVAIVYSNENGIFKFIHSTSGKEHGVTITTMDKTYKNRFVQVRRLLI
jgi:lipoprotein Spr